MPWRRGHPRRRDLLRVVLATASWPVLLAGFVALLAVAAAALAGGFALAANHDEPAGFLYWWRQSLLMLTGFELEATQHDSADSGFQAVQLAGALLRLLIPALLLGAFVFRFLIARNVMVFRKKVALVREGNDHELVFRLYSSTALELVDVRFAFFGQIAGAKGGKGINKVLEQRGFKGIWPVARPHVPYTLRLKLESEDVQGSDLKKLHGTPITPESRILVQIRGSTPQLGTDFVETHAFRLPEDVDSAAYGRVRVDWPAVRAGNSYWWTRKSADWPGFKTFEESR